METNYNQLIVELSRILRGGSAYRDENNLVQFKEPTRPWHRDLQERFALHPAVVKALNSGLVPDDWKLLTLEWPHVSETDELRLAYTRDERGGLENRQVITAVGKYLRRHFPSAPDHAIRDLVALYGGGDSQFKFVRTMEEILHHAENGPTSCMCGKEFHVRCADGTARHPYEVYAPQYGWHMAMRTVGNRTDGRALCIDNYFVRSYKRDIHNSGGYSHADEKLEAWLHEQGYEKRHAYKEGTKLALYFLDRYGDEILAPYIDGDRRCVDANSVDDYMVIDRNGDFECSNTCGTASSEGRPSCDGCGDRCHEDDMTWIGQHGDEGQVCQHCLENNYTYVYGRRCDQYYIRDSYAIEVNGEYYDEDYLSDNNIVQLDNGDYVHLDDAVCIDGYGWYHCDDDDICYAEDKGEHALKEDCWQCASSDKWYTEDTACVEVDGETYHPDHAPEQTTEGE